MTCVQAVVDETQVRLMMEILVTSLPVPQVVGRMMSSFSCFSSLQSKTALVSLPAGATARTLATSMTEPPPMAMMRRKS